MDEEETFDLNTIHEYELQSNEDGSVKLHENCLIISHNESEYLTSDMIIYCIFYIYPEQ